MQEEQFDREFSKTDFFLQIVKKSNNYIAIVQSIQNNSKPRRI